MSSESVDRPEVMNEVCVRPAETEDHALVYATWLASLERDPWFSRPGAPTPTHPIARDAFMTGQHAVVERLLARPETRLDCVCLEASPGTVLAWMCWTPQEPRDLVHYVYTKPVFREFGLARTLLDSVRPGFVTTHRTRLSATILAKSKGFKSVTFNPFLLNK